MTDAKIAYERKEFEELQKNGAKLGNVSGVVSIIEKDGKMKSIASISAIQDGETIITRDGHAIITFPDGSLFELGSNSLFNIVVRHSQIN